MHPKALLDACSELVRLTLKFDHPADAIVSRFFRDNRGLGPRERATLAETVYTVLRKKLLFDHLAPSGSGPKERRLAILGFYGPGDFLRSALTDQEKRWLDQCEAVKPEDLMERHRHNLPEWLVQPLKDQLGAGFWPLVENLNLGAGLDLRVNALKAKRADVQKELQQAGIKAVPTPFSPWGLRIAGKPALNKNEAFLRGDFEVQDEGSQLLAMLVDAKRGEMVVDFCAGAGGKTLALGASMRSTGRLYAFDTSAHRLDALKPRMARSGLSNVHPAAIAHERDDDHRDRRSRGRDHARPPADQRDGHRDRDGGVEADPRVDPCDDREADRLGDEGERCRLGNTRHHITRRLGVATIGWIGHLRGAKRPCPDAVYLLYC